VATFCGRGMALLQYVRIVVRQLFSRLNVTDRLDPDPRVVDDRVAIRIARVVDEPRLVAVHGSIDHDVVVNREQIRVMPLVAAVRIPRVGLRRGETLSRVFDQPRSSWNSLSRKCPFALNRGLTDLEGIARAHTQKNSGFAVTLLDAASRRTRRVR